MKLADFSKAFCVTKQMSCEKDIVNTCHFR
jgi:hypothetical protein